MSCMNCEWTASMSCIDCELNTCHISAEGCMQGWGWSTDEEPAPARAVMPHSTGRHCAMMLGICISIAVASTSATCMVWSVLGCASRTIIRSLTHAVSIALQSSTSLLHLRYSSSLLRRLAIDCCCHIKLKKKKKESCMCCAEYANQLKLWRPDQLSFLFRQVV